MRTEIVLPMAELVPHSGRMRLLDRAIEGDEDSLLASVEIRADSMFYDGHGVGSWVGIEYMAQAVAAWAGWRARLAGGAPKVGFLLGSRRFSTSRAHFQCGEVLLVHAQRQFQAGNGLGHFDCTLVIAGVQVAEAALNVFEPEDVSQFLGMRGNG
jgi:predicted hotdog family 3-hydroxylacyl-ACP dehydratase